MKHVCLPVQNHQYVISPQLLNFLDDTAASEGKRQKICLECSTVLLLLLSTDLVAFRMENWHVSCVLPRHYYQLSEKANGNLS